MIPMLEETLVKRYPTIFRDVGGSPMDTYMAFGLCCGSGWYMLLDRLCAAIMAVPGHEDFKAEQIKEKFGGLRFYGSGGNEAISKLVDVAETQSYRTCEHCGVTTGVKCGGRRWIRALCEVCRPIFDGEVYEQEERRAPKTIVLTRPA